MGNLTAKESGVMASFISPYVKNITSLKVNFSPIQEGSGDPSPTNIRPISGWNSIDINVAGKNLLNATIHTIDFSDDIGTVYGGIFDFVTGELVVTWVKTKISNLASKTWYKLNNSIWYVIGDLEKKKGNSNVISDSYKTDTKRSNLSISGSNSTQAVYFSDDRYSTASEFIEANGDVEFVYELEIPVTYQLTPQQLQTFKGYNNIWSNADSVEVEYELAETFDIQKAKRKIILNQPHTESVSNDIVHFKTNMKAPLKECVINFSPIQEGSGTPSTTNIRPIKGFDDIYLIKCGKNLLRPFNSDTSGGITWTAMDDGSVHASGQKTSSGTLQRTSFVNPGYIPGSPAAGTMTNDFNKGIMLKYGGCWNPVGKKYFDIYPWDTTTSARPKRSSTSTTNAVGVYYDTDVAKAYVPANHVFRVTLRCNTMNVTYDDYVFHPWVYFDDEEDETFEKPMREEYDITFGNIGTIYGGTLNLLTGELVSDKVFVEFNGTESNWIQSASGDATFFRWYYYDDTIKAPSSGALRGCSHFNNAEIYTSTSYIGYLAYTSPSSPNVGWINIRPDLTQISTLEQWKTFLAEQYANGTPVQCWFTKMSPVTYQLTPQQILTLKGTNNIWSNANGDIEIKYWKH